MYSNADIIKLFMAITCMQSWSDNEDDWGNQILLTMLTEKSRIKNCTYIDYLHENLRIHIFHKLDIIWPIILVAVLFVRAKTENDLKNITKGNWLTKFYYIHTLECCMA